MEGNTITGSVVIFDDDHYYMGGVLAEKLCSGGGDVTLVTPAPDVSSWTHNTMEQERIQARLLTLGVCIVTAKNLSAIEANRVELECVYTGDRSTLEAASVVMVTARLPADALYDELIADPEALARAGISSVDCIGDCFAPSTIAAAVYAGHRYAREFDEPAMEGVPFRRELSELSATV